MFIIKITWIFSYVALITLKSFGIFFCKAQDDVFNQISYKISEELKPYQVTIFFNNSKKSFSSEQTILCKEIMHRNPTQLIDVSKINANASNGVFSQTLLRNPRLISVHIIPIDKLSDDDVDYVQRMLQFLIQLTTKSPRPRCLVICFNHEPTSADVFKNIFEYAWIKRFLDFTVIEINLTNSSAARLLYFNPFFNAFTDKNYNLTDQLFVNKLDNVNQYPLRLLLTNMIPFLRISVNRQGKKHVEGLYYLLLEIVAWKMNFKITFYESTVNTLEHTSIIEHSMALLKKGEIDMLTLAMSFVYSEFYKMDLGYHSSESLVAIVPVLSVSRLYIPMYILVYLLLNPLIVISMISCTHWLKIHNIKLGVFKVIQLLFGIPINLTTKRFTDRIVFFSIVLISMQYMMDFYSSVLDMHIVNDDVDLDTFEDMANSNIDIYVNKNYYVNHIPEDSEAARRLKVKMHQLNDIYKCLANLSQRNVMCITSQIYADYYASLYLDSGGQPVTKLAKPVFSQERLSFTTENGFPYTEQFQVIFQRIYESGIWPRRIRKENRTVLSKEDDKFAVKISSGMSFHYQLYAILAIGYATAVLAFSMELMVHSYDLKRMVRFCKFSYKILEKEKGSILL